MIEYNIEISKEQSKELFKYGFKTIISIIYKKNPKNGNLPNEFIVIKHQGWFGDTVNNYTSNNFHEEFPYLMEWIRPFIREHVIEQLIQDKN